MKFPFVVFIFLFASLPSFGWTWGFDAELFDAIEQPIKFSHQTHVEKNGISCEYCHSMARRSKHSGVPPVRTCMGCHIVIQGQTEEEQKEISKLVEYWNNKEPIPWKKVHDLPDHAYFSHKRHLAAGFDCTSCHGDVSKMISHPVPQAARGETPLSMGWCMSCHREEHPIDNNGKIALPVRKWRGGEITGEAPQPVSTRQGPVDCLTCHK